MNIMDLGIKKYNCIRCGKSLPEVNNWLCAECNEHIRSIDKTVEKFHKLSDKERENIIKMSSEEFLDYCKKDVLELTYEEYNVYSVKAFNETIEKPIDGYHCSICNNKLYVQDLIWDNEKNMFVVDHRQCECRKVRISLQLIKKSGLERTIRDYTFDKFTTKEKWQKEIKEKALDFVKNGIKQEKWFMLSGNSGSGKSHCCTAIVRELLYMAIPCRYMVWDSEITELNAIVNDPIFSTRMNELRKIDVLYIDDLFKPVSLNIQPTQGELRRAKDLIDYRYRNKLTTIISTEISIEDICAIDEAIGGRIYEMCKDYYIHISGTDKNYRLR